ncbi:MAG TPA: hypothetical protein VE988_30670 [Gemmataceae bacterium]|nr:hypothetical protein [Gemmataceae bacterium]
MARLISSLCLVAVFGVACAAQPPNQPQHINGTIVKVSPDQNQIVIRVSDGKMTKDFQFDVVKTTRFWGEDRNLVENGLYYGGFKNGTAVWFQRGAGDSLNTITELRLHDPNKK